jgi:hypothetical protein
VVVAADVDGDGDLDVLSGSGSDREIAWYENDGAGSFGPQQLIGTLTTVTSAIPVAAMDVDGDGDLDVVVSSLAESLVAWYENTDGAGSFGSQRVISSLADGGEVTGADVDSDGDVDVLSASFQGDQLAWYENETIHRSAVFGPPNTIDANADLPNWVSAGDLDRDGDQDALIINVGTTGGIRWRANNGAGGFGAANLIATANHARVIRLADMDRDGDPDLVTAATLGSPGLAWHENTAPQTALSWTTRTISSGYPTPYHADVGDIDGDGDLDVFASSNPSAGDPSVAWFENTAGDGSAWSQHAVGTTQGYAVDVRLADVDGDGDLDAFYCDTNYAGIAWKENTAGDGSAWTDREIESSSLTATPNSVEPADMDGDGDVDVVVASRSSYQSAWFENPGGVGSWTRHLLGSPAKLFWLRASDLDRDGDLDVVGAGEEADRLYAFENTAGDGTSWTVTALPGTPDQPLGLEAADLDGDGDDDVLAAGFGDSGVVWLENAGGQFALPTADLAPRAAADGATNLDLLRIDVTHRGRSGDSELELVTFELRFEDAVGTPLSSAQANALISELRIHRDDDGSGHFTSGADSAVATIGTLTLSGGALTIPFTDGDANVQVGPVDQQAYFVVVNLDAAASGQTPSAFRVVHLTESSSSAEDRSADIPLSLELQADTVSTAVQAFSPDDDADGLSDAQEAGLGTDPDDSDTDGDGLYDGEEVALGLEPVATNDSSADSDSDGLTDLAEITTHGTDPQTLDTDGDGTDDGSEVGSTDPLTSSIPFQSHTIEGSLAGPIPSLPADLDGDGDLDLPAVATSTVYWYRNVNGDGSSWNREANVATLSGVVVAISPDLDRDGDSDLLSASGLGIAWYENTAGDGSSWSASPIVSGTAAIRSLVWDMDEDGDFDVLGGTATSVTWYENDGSQGTWTPHVVATTAGFGFPNLVDLDGDGDADVVSSVASGPLEWHENVLGDGSAWATHSILPGPALPGGSRFTYAADFDGDGAHDIVVQAPGRLLWVENVLGDGSYFRARGVSRATAGVPAVFAHDADADGDVDLFAPDPGDGIVAWHENTAGDGSSWRRGTIATGIAGANTAVPFAGWTEMGPFAAGEELLLGATPVCCRRADLDGDGDLDPYWSSSSALGWAENLSIHRSASFPSRRDIPAGTTSPAGVATADFDRDGDLDLAVASSGSGVVRWHANAGAGSSFGAGQAIDASAPGAADLTPADLDGDGDPDLIAGSDGDDSLAWHENRIAEGLPWSETLIDRIDDPRAPLAADLDADGDLDVVAGSEQLVGIHLYRNESGAFSPREAVASGVSAQGLAAGDLDRDGDLDLVAANEAGTNDHVDWYENEDGAGGSWAQHGIRFATNLSPESVDVIDVDADRDLDVVSCNSGSKDVVWHASDGTPQDGGWTLTVIGGQATLPDPNAFANCTHARAADFDCDGDADVISWHTSPGRTWYFENTSGDGSQWTRTLTSPAGSAGGTLGDLDGDGRLDAIGVREGVALVSWLPDLGGQFALPTAARGYQGMVDGQALDVLRIDATHRGRVADSDATLTSVELELQDAGGAPLSDAEANNLFGAIRLYADDGSGAFEVGVDGIAAVVLPPFTLNSGVLELAPGGSVGTLVAAVPELLFVVPTLVAGASGEPTNQFQIVHRTESSSSAADASTGLPLSLEFHANTSSGVIQALAASGDADGDGLQNTAEAATHGSDPLDPDTDGDTLGDGDEVTVHGSDPLDPDSDDDGLQDGAEVAQGTDPNDEDTDGDLVCDGGAQVGTCTAVGPDNCPFVANFGQQNGDAFAAGNACQCGDVTGEGTLDAADYQRAREYVVNRTSGPFDLDRCDVSGDAACDVEDLAVLDRALGAAGALVYGCEAYTGP